MPKEISSRAFSARSEAVDIPGALPQACNEAAPLALNRYFYWQRGYGACSVSQSQLDAHLEYVDTQEEHHRSRIFQEEYREFLRKHDVEYDEMLCMGLKTPR